MDMDFLKDQIDNALARAEEIDKKIINLEPDQKGYKELVDSYNKWIDTYKTMMDKFLHYDDPDVEVLKLELEREKLKIQQEIEQDKLNLDTEKVHLDREKFAYDVEQNKKRELIDIIFKSVDVGAKVLVPTLSLTGIIYVANLAYMNDADLKLCNGRIIGGVKDILKIMKV